MSTISLQTRFIQSIECTSIATPLQYEGVLEDGSELYIRCRSGWAQVRVNDELVLSEEYDDKEGEPSLLSLLSKTNISFR